MEAVYSLLNVERGVPEVFNSVYDIRELLKVFYYLNDKKAIKDMDLPIPGLIEKIGRKKLKGTFIEELLQEAHLM